MASLLGSSVMMLTAFRVCSSPGFKHGRRILLSAPCIRSRRWLFSRGSTDSELTLDQLALNLKQQKYQRVIVMVGAGISTPSGIPDFRSPGSGLYSNLQQYNLPYAEAIFELDYFHANPKPFFTLAKELYPGNYRPNEAHVLCRLLLDKQLLQRLYTQNIDGLERLAGIPAEKLVEAHGTFATATCTVCRRKYSGDEIRPAVMSGSVPECPTCTGVIKPDIVFFGEELPAYFLKYLTDFPLADLLIVMGTSLEVEPFASLAGAVRPTVPRLLVNRDPVGPFLWRRRSRDVVLLGDLVQGVRTLVRLLDWTTDMERVLEELQVSEKSEE